MTTAAEVTEAFFGDQPERIDPKSVRVRHSHLKQMALSPAHYLSAIREDREETLALRLGSGVHAMLLGKPWALWTGKVRNGKAWDAFEAEHAGAAILNQREYAEASGMIDALTAHRDAMSLLAGAEFERELHFAHELRGRACRATPDAFTPGRLVELKTTRSSEPARFNRDGLWRGYHSQLAWYRDAIVRSGAGSPSAVYIIAVESTKPHPVTVFEVTDRALDEGRKATRLWLESLLVCEDADHWPGYVESIVPFDVDDAGDLTLRVGGEEIDL